MKRTRLRPKSKKRAKQDRELAPHLEAYKAEFPVCQVCNRARGESIHEIARGSRSRMKARAQRATIMHLCEKCHRAIQNEEFLWQCARKFVSDSGFDLEIALQVKNWAPGYIEMWQVEAVAAGFGWEHLQKGRMG